MPIALFKNVVFVASINIYAISLHTFIQFLLAHLRKSVKFV